VAPATHAIAAQALQAGQVVPLAWRAPWVSVHPCVIRLRNRRLQEAEQAFLDLLRDADAEAEREAGAWFRAAGLSAECG
jgi:hypothetical protein